MSCTKRVMDFLFLLFLLLNLSSTFAYRTPFCFSSGVTWSSPVSGGVQAVPTPEECQLLCADESNCNSVTWYNGEASPHPDYCEMFLSPEENKQAPCSNCSSGPESCLCSAGYTCSLDNDQLVDLVFSVKSEFLCAELCYTTSECNFYTWFSPSNLLFTDTCALLTDCTKRAGSDTCRSGPSSCTDTDILEEEYPLCYTIGSTWLEETSRGLPNITSPYICQELCQQEEGCFSFTWYNAIAHDHQNFCEFYSFEKSEPNSPCSECISGLSSCTCSATDHKTCDTNHDLVIDIVQYIESEVQCQDLCARDGDCTWYTWYSGEGDRFQFTCILLLSCTQKMECQGCTSGPDNCENVALLPLPTAPQCSDYKLLTSFTRNRIIEQHNFCSGSYCNDVTTGGYASYATPDWSGEGWYRFSGAAGSQLAETLPGYLHCGTAAAGYMAGGHPTIEEGYATRTVYFERSGNNHLGFPKNITVINCHDFYVYHLTDVDEGNLGYCGE